MNRYDHLRHEEFPDAPYITDYEAIRITDSNAEVIDILLVEAEPGKFAAGYMVYWADGRQSTRSPCLMHGWFSTKRDAILFYLGYMEQYLQSFREETADAIMRKMSENSQKELF